MDTRRFEISNMFGNHNFNPAVGFLARAAIANGVMPTMGLTHSPYGNFAGAPFGMPVEPVSAAYSDPSIGLAGAIAPIVGQWGGAFGLSHTPALTPAYGQGYRPPIAGAWGYPWGPSYAMGGDVWWQQQLIWQALCREQLQTIATLRAMGCPV